MTLPILLSVPHAGTDVPEALRPKCLLTHEQIVRDGDEGAREIYALSDHVRHFVTTDVARAVLDMNRAEGDLRRDGIVKTHTCWDEPIWSTPLSEDEIEMLLSRHHRPYHARLSELAGADGVILGVDGHTMAVAGPPVGPDPGKPRPEVCIGIGDGTIPRDQADDLVACFRDVFDGEVTLNDPFSGGYITRYHGARFPWVQIELSRTPEPSLAEKRRRVLAALTAWCDHRTS